MSNRYAPLPNPRTDPENNELEAAFDDSDDEDTQETMPLQQSIESHLSSPLSSQAAQVPGTYNFENVDYDYPPPGSPPAPSAVAFPNNHGNSNGVIPVFTIDSAPRHPQRSRGWFSRTAASILPSHYVQSWGFLPRTGAIGGGTNNDGVFANVTAKPSRGSVVVQDGDEQHLVPEETQSEAPPSYATAQADAVPPYWETTILAPFSPSTPGDVVVDSLPTGSLFSFLWNALISVSFQFIGFLLTYLLHTTHAARFGSRAGLGITLIQYGFGLRARLDDNNSGMGDGVSGQGNDPWRWPYATGSNPAPTFATKAEADEYYYNILNSTSVSSVHVDTNIIVADATTEWLAFLLMTVGWFVLLTSALGYWRVKRWERSILASSTSPPSEAQTSERRGGPFSSLESTLGFSLLSRRRHASRPAVEISRPTSTPPTSENALRANDEDDSDGEGEELRPMLLSEEDMRADPERARRLVVAIEAERRLQADLRAAGLL